MTTEVVVGRLGAAHGVRGELAVRVRTDEPDRRFAVGGRFTVESDRPRTERRDVTLTAVRTRSGQPDSLLVTFAEVADRDAAVALSGSWLLAHVPADERPADEDEFYDHQLVGLTVVAADDTTIGTVAEVVHLPLQDVLAVDLSDGRHVLVPFVADIVTDVDLDGAQIRLDPPPGLLDSDEAAAPERTAGS